MSGFLDAVVVSVCAASALLHLQPSQSELHYRSVAQHSAGMGASNADQSLSASMSLLVTSRASSIDPNHTWCASDRLFSVRQGTRSVAKYSVEFCTLSAESGWNEPALQSAFCRVLSDSVRDAHDTRPASLNEVIDHAIEHERSSRPPLLRSLTHRRPSPQHASPFPVASDPRAPVEKPMQLGAQAVLLGFVSLLWKGGHEMVSSASRSAGRRILSLPASNTGRPAGHAALGAQVITAASPG